jgi:hypothetical protein
MGSIMMKTHLYISASTFNDIKEALADNRKIKAIKILRAATKTGLKEAKFAIDRYTGASNEGPILSPCYDIMGVILRTPEGDITVDLEGLQLTGLMSMNTMGLETCRAVLSLHDAITEWRDSMTNMFFDNKEKLTDE